MSALDLFAIGNAIIDQEFQVSETFLIEQNLTKGTMQLTDGDTQANLYQNLMAHQVYKGQASGGSAANTTVAFAALGGRAFYGCRVGQGEAGQFYLDGLSEVGIGTAQQSICEGVTGTCMVLITPDTERTMHTYLGTTADLSVDQIDYATLAQAKWLYIEGYLSTSDSAREAVLKARQVAKQHQIKTALSLSDPAMVQYARAGLEEMLAEGVDLLFCNEQEALLFTQQGTLDAALEQLLTYNNTVVITLGEKGALVATSAEKTYVDGRKVKAVDTNGAGDAFAGAFLYAVQQGFDLEQAAELAILISSEVVAQFGPRLAVEKYARLLKTMELDLA
ncbi:adenosine kinase [Acinetobacter sp. MD2(2019)]|uniref:adenosine kinase n=1 Tax=Acinetobacter sp. MD2(2019) TaxID=2605273 RepID=UPI002D1E66CC|nr:adenosine kinase [Acinetobacter sp. MD2(2019)]MEB3754201.1 adenosine kinase [Acinetobacter sp. MD2(2019)]